MAGNHRFGLARHHVGRNGNRQTPSRLYVTLSNANAKLQCFSFVFCSLPVASLQRQTPLADMPIRDCGQSCYSLSLLWESKKQVA